MCEFKQIKFNVTKLHASPMSVRLYLCASLGGNFNARVEKKLFISATFPAKGRLVSGRPHRAVGALNFFSPTPFPPFRTIFPYVPLPGGTLPSPPLPYELHELTLHTDSLLFLLFFRLFLIAFFFSLSFFSFKYALVLKINGR